MNTPRSVLTSSSCWDRSVLLSLHYCMGFCRSCHMHTQIQYSFFQTKSLFCTQTLVHTHTPEHTCRRTYTAVCLSYTKYLQRAHCSFLLAPSFSHPFSLFSFLWMEPDGQGWVLLLSFPPTPLSVEDEDAPIGLLRWTYYSHTSSYQLWRCQILRDRWVTVTRLLQNCVLYECHHSYRWWSLVAYQTC